MAAIEFERSNVTVESEEIGLAQGEGLLHVLTQLGI
jgi:hypothetical protein